VDVVSSSDAFDFDAATGSLTVLGGRVETMGRCVRAIGAGGSPAAPARIQISDTTLLQSGGLSIPAVEARLAFPLQDETLELVLLRSNLVGAHGIETEVDAVPGVQAEILADIEDNLLSGAGSLSLVALAEGRLDATVLSNVALPGAGVSVFADTEGLCCVNLDGNSFDLFELIAGDDSSIGIACTSGVCVVNDELDAAFEVSSRNTGTVNTSSGTNSTWFECSGQIVVP
jgi:hypothetical protein